jgi:hypothetical protein
LWGILYNIIYINVKMGGFYGEEFHKG